MWISQRKCLSEFKASRGWFDKFKKQTGIHSMVRHSEVASSDKRGAEEFVNEFKDYVLRSMIKDMCAEWNELQSFVGKYHPNKAVASHLCNMFNDTVLSNFRQILKRRQKQTSLDRFFVRQWSSDSQAGPSASKRQRREVTLDRKVTPDRTLIPEFLMEEDSPSKQ